MEEDEVIEMENVNVKVERKNQENSKINFQEEENTEKKPVIKEKETFRLIPTSLLSRICLIGFIVFFLFIIIVIILMIFDRNPQYLADKECLKFLNSTEMMTVKNINGEYVFIPNTNSTHDTGLIYYPGGAVENIAYAPFVHAVAEKLGITGILLRSPFSLGILDIFDANKFINGPSYSHIKSWILAGHSLGGVTATMLIGSNPKHERIKGFVLLGSTSAVDISSFSGSGLSIYAEYDLLQTEAECNATKHLLPPNTIFYKIYGGNHAKMGFYGSQIGDGIAKISKYQQMEIIVNQTALFIEKIQN